MYKLNLPEVERKWQKKLRYGERLVLLKQVNLRNPIRLVYRFDGDKYGTNGVEHLRLSLIHI